MLEKGGIKSNKWCSNVPDVLPKRMQSIQMNENPKVLALEWVIEYDVFRLCHGMLPEVRDCWTKRQVLSVLSGVFDPFGIVALFVK